MKTFKITLRLLSGFATPLQADTLFGHFCWIVANEEGADGIRSFLTPYMQGDPPFIISDGFPYDYLPKPFSLDARGDTSKEIKKEQWLAPEQFSGIIGGKNPTELTGFKEKKAVIMHNSISRLNNMVLAAGGLFGIEETFNEEATLYVRIKSDDWLPKIKGLFDSLEKTGFGKKRSTGKGQFEVKEITAFEFTACPQANAFVTLSSFCPCAADPTDGYYKLFTKYGKLGDAYNYCGNPFKKPMVFIKAGSVFKTGPAIKEHYGRMLSNVATAKPDEVVQYAYAFPVPMVVNKT
jgi:CRISPR-associated protein Csm4